MMIKVSNEFLDFDELIEIEKQIKLFEDISTTDGDFSYAFELQKTIHNTRLLQNPFPDNISKPVYQKIPAKILSDSGAETFDGYIRVERVTSVYECSLFAGNNNWFARLTGLLSELDLSRYDIDNNEINIIDSWSLQDGLVFPLLDNGGLITRAYYQLKIEDFVGGFYIKTIFNKVFTEAGIKIQGELLEDWRYQHAICINNSKDTGLIEANTSYVEKNVAQNLPHNTLTKVTWDQNSVLPFFDGASNNFNLTTDSYTAPLKMTVTVDVTTVMTSSGDFGVNAVHIYVNGVSVRVKAVGFGSSLPESVNSQQVSIQLNEGDVIEIYEIEINVDTDSATIERGTIKITPTYIYRTIGSTAVPNWTKQQFVSNILRIFNVMASYKEGSQTLTLNLFENLKSKPPLDLSEFISDTDVDYSEFISSYGRRSKLSYKEVEFDELKTYNQGKFFKYGQGVISVDNDFLENDKSIIESDFANPIAYVNPVFDASLEKTNLIELEDGEEAEFSNVGDDGFGDAAFNVGSSDPFAAGDLVRVKDSTNIVYNGDWVVKTTDGIHVVFNGLPFDTGASGTLVKLRYKYSSSEDVFIFLNLPNYQVNKFSQAPMVFDSGTFYPIEFTNVALAYFDMINQGRQVNKDFIYSLSFGGIDDPLHYQVTMIESYFRLFSQILNDPVKLLSVAHLPYDVFDRIDFLRPITIKTIETSNMYYLNRISGYKESYLPCELELIKLPSGNYPSDRTADVVQEEEGETPTLPTGEGFDYQLDMELA
jgi:hypothetical protein